MISYVTGVPGSGKSYYGLFTICINFLKNKDLINNKKFKNFKLSKIKYKYCLTNINEINQDLFDNLHILNIDNFLVDIDKLHRLYLSGYTDKDILDYINENDLKLAYCLLVIDECHNFLDKDNKSLNWWLSYHRHLFQDIILITQSLDLVNKKYKVHTEIFYKAIPSSQKLQFFSNNMIYQRYIGYQFFKTQKTNTYKLPIINDFFKSYGSGENHKQKNVASFYIMLFFILVIFVLFGLIYLKYFMYSSDTKYNTIDINTSIPLNDINQNITTKKKVYKDTKNHLDDNYKLFKIYCNKSLCFSENNIYPKSLLTNLLNKFYDYKVLNVSDNTTYFLFEDTLNIFTKDNINDDTKKTTANFSLIPNS